MTAEIKVSELVESKIRARVIVLGGNSDPKLGTAFSSIEHPAEDTVEKLLKIFRDAKEFAEKLIPEIIAEGHTVDRHEVVRSALISFAQLGLELDRASGELKGSATFLNEKQKGPLSIASLPLWKQRELFELTLLLSPPRKPLREPKPVLPELEPPAQPRKEEKPKHPPAARIQTRFKLGKNGKDRPFNHRRGLFR